MTELKKCPFCGGEAKICYSDYSKKCMIFCKNVYECGARQEYFDTEKEAIEAWNRRAE